MILLITEPSSIMGPYRKSDNLVGVKEKFCLDGVKIK